MRGLVIGGYLLALIGIGVFSSRKAKGSEGFFVANRSGGMFLVAGSLVATILGGSSTIGMAGLGYVKGLPGAWWLLVGCVGLVLSGAFIAKKVRMTRAYTLPEILGNRYGKGVREVASLIILVSWLGIIAGQILAAGKILSTLYPHVNLNGLILLSGSVMVSYTILGGQYSILKTDSFQAILILVGVVLTVMIGTRAAGGMSGVVLKVPEGFLDFPTNVQTSWSYVGKLMMFVGTAYLVGPDIFSRFLSSETEVTAQRAAWLSAGVLVFAAFAITWVGILGRVLYPKIAPEQVFPHMVLQVLPGLFSPLVVAALLAAVISSADTCLLTAGVILSSDILGGVLRQKAGSDREFLKISRLFVLVIGLMSLGIALYMRGIIKSLLLGYTVFTSGLVLPALLAFTPARLRISPRWVGGAIAIGGIIALWGKLIHHDNAGVYGMGFCALMLVAGMIQGKRRIS